MSNRYDDRIVKLDRLPKYVSGVKQSYTEKQQRMVEMRVRDELLGLGVVNASIAKRTKE